MPANAGDVLWLIGWGLDGKGVDDTIGIGISGIPVGFVYLHSASSLDTDYAQYLVALLFSANVVKFAFGGCFPIVVVDGFNEGVLFFFFFVVCHRCILVN